MLNEKIKIAFLFSGDLWAGAEVMIYHHLKTLKSYRNIELIAISNNYGFLTDNLVAEQIKTFVVDEQKHSLPLILWKTLSILRKQKVNIIHTHRYKENIIAGMLSPLLGNPKMVTTQHGLPESNHINIINIINHWIMKCKFHHVVAVSENIKKNFIANLAFSEKKISVIKNGVAIPESISTSNKKNYFHIGSAGRFFPVKNYNLLINIAARLHAMNKHVRFTLMGDGPERKVLEELVQKNKIEHIFIMPGFSTDLTDFYSSLDLYINTSLHEGTPMSVLEAMAYSLPVIAPKTGGFPDIVTNESGFLINPGNIDDYCKKILLLMENSKLIKTMGTNARERLIEQFSNKVMTDKYYQLYENILLCSKDIFKSYGN